MTSEPERKHASEMTYDEFVDALRHAQHDSTSVDVDDVPQVPLRDGETRVYFDVPGRPMP